MARRSWQPFQTCKPGAVPSPQVLPSAPFGGCSLLGRAGERLPVREPSAFFRFCPSGAVRWCLPGAPQSQVSCRGTWLSGALAARRSLFSQSCRGQQPEAPGQPAWHCRCRQREQGSCVAALAGGREARGRAQRWQSRAGKTILADGSSFLMPCKQDVILSPRLMAPEFQELASLVFLVFPFQR